MIKALRFGPYVLGLLTVLLIVMSARASCTNREWVPYLGKWTGEFAASGSGEAARRQSLFGYLMVYAMDRSFKMHLEGPQEILDVSGVWTLRGRRLVLTPKGVKIDDEGGASVRNPNLPFVPGDEVHAAYAHPFVLELSADRRRLIGLPMSMGPRIGRHEFARD